MSDNKYNLLLALGCMLGAILFILINNYFANLLFDSRDAKEICNFIVGLINGSFWMHIYLINKRW